MEVESFEGKTRIWHSLLQVLLVCLSYRSRCVRPR